MSTAPALTAPRPRPPRTPPTRALAHPGPQSQRERAPLPLTRAPARGLTSPALAALAALTALAACAPPPARVPLCPPSPIGDAAEALADPSAWAHLLVPDFDLRRDPLATPRACTGDPIDAPPPRRDAAPRPLPREPPTALDLSVITVDDRLLVWLRLDHFPDGDALGPVALVTRRGALEVTAIGPLRAPATIPSLRHARLADGASILIVEGERCPDAAPCVREAHLLAIDPPRLHDLRLHLPGSPSAAARIALVEDDERPGAPGWIERRRLERRLIADDRGLALTLDEELIACPNGHPTRCQTQLRRAHRCELGRRADALVCVDLAGDR